MYFKTVIFLCKSDINVFNRSAGGKFIDASPEFEQQVRDEMEKLKKQFGATADFDKFPTFNFTGYLTIGFVVIIQISNVSVED